MLRKSVSLYITTQTYHANNTKAGETRKTGNTFR